MATWFLYTYLKWSRDQSTPQVWINQLRMTFSNGLQDIFIRQVEEEIGYIARKVLQNTCTFSRFEMELEFFFINFLSKINSDDKNTENK